MREDAPCRTAATQNSIPVRVNSIALAMSASFQFQVLCRRRRRTSVFCRAPGAPDCGTMARRSGPARQRRHRLVHHSLHIRGVPATSAYPIVWRYHFAMPATEAAPSKRQKHNYQSNDRRSGQIFCRCRVLCCWNVPEIRWESLNGDRALA